MEFIQLEVNCIENYIEVLNKAIIQIKENEELRLENAEELYKLYDLYKTLQTCYFAFSNAVQRLRAIPIQIWSECLIGENPNMDLIGITNYLKRVDTFFKKFRDEIQNLPQLYWREVPPTAEVNCDKSQNALHTMLSDSLVPPFQNRNPVQQTSIAPNSEIRKTNGWSSTEQNIKINELVHKPVESCTKLEEAPGLQLEKIELGNCVEVKNLTDYLAITAHESISGEIHLDPEENLNITPIFVSCTPGSTEVDKQIDLEPKSNPATEPLSETLYEQVELNNVNDGLRLGADSTAKSNTIQFDQKLALPLHQNIRKVEEFNVVNSCKNDSALLEAGYKQVISPIENNSIDTSLKESYNISTVRVQSEDIYGEKENDNIKKLLIESSKDSCINIPSTKEYQNEELGTIKEVINSLTGCQAFTTYESIYHQVRLDPEDDLDYFRSDDITCTTDSTEVDKEIEHEPNSDTESEILDTQAGYQKVEYSSNDNDDLRIGADSKTDSNPYIIDQNLAPSLSTDFEEFIEKKVESGKLNKFNEHDSKEIYNTDTVTVQTEEIDKVFISQNENDSNKELSAKPSKVNTAYIPSTGHDNIRVEPDIEIVNNLTSTTIKLMCEQVLLDLEDTLNYFPPGDVSCAADSTEVDIECKHGLNSSAELESLSQAGYEQVEFTPKENGDLRLCGDLRTNSNNNQIGLEIGEVQEFIEKALDSCKLGDHADKGICHAENPSNITIQYEIKDNKKNNKLLTESSKLNYLNISCLKGHGSTEVEHSIETGYSVFTTSEQTWLKKYSNEEGNASCNNESIVGSKEIEVELNSATELEILSQDIYEQIKCSSDRKVRLTSSESELCSDSDPPYCNDAGALGYYTVPSNEGIEIISRSLSSQFNSSIDIDDSSNNSTVSTTKANILPVVEQKMSASESQSDVRGYGFKDYLSDSTTADVSFVTSSSSDPDSAPKQENEGLQASGNGEAVWALLDDVITSALDNSSINPSLDLSDTANPFYRSLLNQWKHVMINNTIDIKFIKTHYENDIFGYCRFITNAEDLQNLHLIRFVMAGNEISGIELLSQN